MRERRRQYHRRYRVRQTGMMKFWVTDTTDTSITIWPIHELRIIWRNE